jgi:hypothetical protein
MEQNLNSPQLDDDSKKRRKTSHQYLEFDGVIYIDISPSHSKAGDVLHNLDEETATLVDAQEELVCDDFDEEKEEKEEEKEEFTSNFWNTDSPLKLQQNIAESLVTVPISRRVRMSTDVLFPPNWCNDDETASMPEIDYEEDDDSINDYSFHNTCSSGGSCVASDLH